MAYEAKVITSTHYGHDHRQEPTLTDGLIEVKPPLNAVGEAFAEVVLGRGKIISGLRHILTNDEASYFIATAHIRNTEGRTSMIQTIAERVTAAANFPERALEHAHEDPFPK
jgi:hypothetical protein